MSRKEMSTIIVFKDINEFKEERDDLIQEYNGDFRNIIIRIETCTDNLDGLWRGSKLVYPPFAVEVIRNSFSDPLNGSMEDYYAECPYLMTNYQLVVYEKAWLYKISEEDLIDLIVNEVCKTPNFILPVLGRFKTAGNQDFRIVLSKTSEPELGRLVDMIPDGRAFDVLSNIASNLDTRLQNFISTKKNNFEFEVKGTDYDDNVFRIYISKTEKIGKLN